VFDRTVLEAAEKMQKRIEELRQAKEPCRQLELSFGDGVERPGTALDEHPAFTHSGNAQYFSPTVMFHSPRLSQVCAEKIKSIAPLKSPVSWADFNTIDAGVSQIRELPQQILHLPHQDVRCSILELQYDEYDKKVRGLAGPIRYWVDVDSHLIRRAEFHEASPHGTQSWIVTIDKIKLGGSPPSWLAQGASSSNPGQLLVGKLAPDFRLSTSDGKIIHLADLRGRIVLLDFWATWCASCEEEIPALEQLQVDHIPLDLVLLGVSDEDASVLRNWLEENHRSFPTLVDAKRTFQDFGIGAIPVLVIINRQGIVTNFISGFRSERWLYPLVKDALFRPTSNLRVPARP
jgi:peroxiredoxin